AAVEGDTVEVLKSLTDMPLEIGCGIRDLETIDLYDKLGIDYFILGTRAIMDVPWLKEAVAKYPGRIYVGLDCKDEAIYINGWKEASGRYIQEYLDEIADLDIAGIKIGRASCRERVERAERTEGRSKVQEELILVC